MIQGSKLGFILADNTIWSQIRKPPSLHLIEHGCIFNSHDIRGQKVQEIP